MIEILYPTTKKYTFFLSVYGPFSRLGHKIGLKNSERIEIIQSISSHNNGVKLETTKGNCGNSQVCGN